MAASVPSARHARFHPCYGDYETYDVGGNAIEAAYLLGQVPMSLTFTGLGNPADDAAACLQSRRMHGSADAVTANNAEWLDRISYIDFLRDFGRHFSVNRMLTFAWAAP